MQSSIESLLIRHENEHGRGRGRLRSSPEEVSLLVDGDGPVIDDKDRAAPVNDAVYFKGAIGDCKSFSCSSARARGSSPQSVCGSIVAGVERNLRVAPEERAREERAQSKQDKRADGRRHA